MPKRTTGLTDAHARLHKNRSYELLVSTWLMNGGWQVFTPLLDAAHAVDLIVSDGPQSYRVQIKSIESQDESCHVRNQWKGRNIDFVIYFAQRSNWGYICPAFFTNQKRLDDPAHQRFERSSKSFLAAFHATERQPGNIIPLPPGEALPPNSPRSHSPALSSPNFPFQKSFI